MREIKIKGDSGILLYLTIWDKVEKPQGIVQLLHAANDYSKHYKDFAKFLNDNNWIVVSHDHRGHGKTAEFNNNSFGFFAEENGWKKIISDTKIVNQYIKNNYPNLKLALIGHSFGSYIARSYAIMHSDTIDYLVISATVWPYKIQMHYMKYLAKRYVKTLGSTKPCEPLLRLVNKRFLKNLPDPSDLMSWCTQNKQINKKQLADPYTSFTYSASAWRDIFTGLLFITSLKNINKTRKDLPILFIGGADDSVTRNTKEVIKSYKKFLKSGFSTIKLNIFQDMRHDIFKDHGKESVYDEILAFIRWTL